MKRFNRIFFRKKEREREIHPGLFIPPNVYFVRFFINESCAKGGSGTESSMERYLFFENKKVVIP